jgi:hypothetical protein
MSNWKLPVNYSKLHWKQIASVRKQYITEQRGKCHHCGGDLKLPPPQCIQNYKINWSLFPDKFLKYPVHLHHSHTTGMTIGAVHSLCNAVLWQYHGE